MTFQPINVDFHWKTYQEVQGFIKNPLAFTALDNLDG